MGRIVAIGGGEISKGETESIDRFIVEISGKAKPHFLFVPTASRDAGGYINTMKRVYKTQYGCEYSTLLFYLANPTDEIIREKLEWADIIYVGGGNTAEMMDMWRSRGLDVLLRDAYHNTDKVLCGVSAGSICWFKRGHSDSNAFTNPDGVWDYVSVDGLSLIDAVHCPHYNESGRESFDGTIGNELGIALENGTALAVIDGEMQILSSIDGARAYLFKDGQKTALPNGKCKI